MAAEFQNREKNQKQMEPSTKQDRQDETSESQSSHL